MFLVIFGCSTLLNTIIELADIMNYAFLIADKYQLDIKDIILSKLAQNAEKYPVDKSKGNAKKYTEL